MDFKGAVVLADDQTVADAAEICPKGIQGFVHGLADNKYRVEGEGDVLAGEGGKVRLILGGGVLLEFRHRIAPHLRQHAFQNQKIALSAGVYHAGFFQHGIHVGGLGQGFVALPDGRL